MLADSPRPGPRFLAFDTSTQEVSAALQWGERSWEYSGPGGGQASGSLIPALQALMQQAGLRWQQLDAIAFGSGPGSFTGLRTACAVAQGLGFGAGVPLLPVPTLAAVAEGARHTLGLRRVVAALDARMDELYVASYDFDSKQDIFDAGHHLVSPEKLHVPEGFALVGNVQAVYGPRLAWRGPSHAALPTAAAMLRLCPALLEAGLGLPAEQARPLYLRDKVAYTSAERADLKRAALAAHAAGIP